MAGTQSRNLKQKPWRCDYLAALCLAHWFPCSRLSQRAQAHPNRAGAAPSGLSPPTSTSNQDNPSQTWPSQSDLFSPLLRCLQTTLSFVKLTANTMVLAFCKTHFLTYFLWQSVIELTQLRRLVGIPKAFTLSLLHLNQRELVEGHRFLILPN